MNGKQTDARTHTLGYFALAAVVLIAYHPALRLNFFGDDYAFVERAGRSTLGEYLSFYFDPARQDGWYRPIQGMVFGIEWLLFGANPLGYHLVNVLGHLANTLLLFAIIERVTRQWRAAFLAALIYCALPLYAVAVFWPGDADFLLTFFYLLSIYFWIRHLQSNHLSTCLLAYFFFLLALTTKEFGVTLPIALFLIERWVVAAPFNSWRDAWHALAPWRDFRVLARYLPFLLIYAVYLPMEYAIQSRSVLTNLYGYGARDQALPNLAGYLAALAFPWGLPEALNWIWLSVVAILLAWHIYARKLTNVLTVCLVGTLTFLPVILFPWFLTRYLYMAVMAFALMFAFGLARALARGRVLARALALGALALIVVGNAAGTADAAAGFAELGRQQRVPFRDISQRHPNFADDTLLYFVNPPTLASELSGMFFVRYDARVTVASAKQTARRADLRAHAHAYVIWFDEQQRTREIAVEKALRLEDAPRAPIDFGGALRLEGYELANARVTRGEALALILYWRVTGKIEDEYAVVARLEDENGQPVATLARGENQPLRRARSAQVGEGLVDVVIIPVAPPVARGDSYRLAIELGDANGKPVGARVLFKPIEVRSAE